jgi:S-adenosylmethionine-diacylgycerolhomoserine-N-methlytransferase
MSVVQDLKTLYHLVCKRVHGNTHAERLESFYSGQAGDYDAFRERLLNGRQEMLVACEQARRKQQEARGLQPKGLWIDIGGGTGRNLAFCNELRESFKQAIVVDLSPSLLKRVEQRKQKEKWSNVSSALADATSFQISDLQKSCSTDISKEPVNLITFSYSLTMIPDWHKAIDHALPLLAPDGLMGVVDFYVSRKHKAKVSFNRHPRELGQHSWFTRTFWPTWFALDNVFLSPDHLSFLLSRLEPVELEERVGKVPYIPLIRVPYYTLVGKVGEIAQSLRQQ